MCALPCHLFYLLHFPTTLKLYLSTLLITYLKCCYDYDRMRVVSLWISSLCKGKQSAFVERLKEKKGYKLHQVPLNAGKDPIINVELNHMVPVKN